MTNTINVSDLSLLKLSSLSRIIEAPIMTDKAYAGAQSHIYTVQVSLHATKKLVAEAFEKIFGVVPLAVNILNQKGKVKRKRIGNKTHIVCYPTRKKAMVRLSPDVQLDLIPTA